MIKFASLGSGSKGNATLVCVDDTCLLIDCGYSIRELERRLDQLDLVPQQLSAVLVTHEHSDHIKGVGALSRRYRLPVYMTAGSYLESVCGELHQYHSIKHSEAFHIEDVRITPVAVPHDAREPCQYIFEYNQLKLGVLTDLGIITPYILALYQGCHGLLVEANHDSLMLSQGPYPPSLKARVGSNWGHLNNVQTAEFLGAVDSRNLRHILIGHISEKNNHIDAIQSAVAENFRGDARVTFANQDHASDWIYIE